MKITTYHQARAYLEDFLRFTFFEKQQDDAKLTHPLERMLVLTKLLGNPDSRLKSVLVGGTSGKGSTAYLTASILTSAGYKTGLFTKPHLEKINERFRINGEEISDQQLLDLVNQIVPLVNKMSMMRVGRPSYIEIFVAMAFVYFAEKKVDIAVVEVAMGGEFDPTNVLYPLISVLTNVSLDHTDYLGKTVQKIAKTKAGIIKQSEKLKVKNETLQEVAAPVVVTGVTQPSVIKIVEKRCKDIKVPLYRLHKDFFLSTVKNYKNGIQFNFHFRKTKIRELFLSLHGRYQAMNASLAIATVLQLKQFGFEVGVEHIREAMQHAFFAGRFEETTLKVESLELKVILDGAHNPQKMRLFTQEVVKIYPRKKKIVITAVKKTKDASMLRYLCRIAENIIVTDYHATVDQKKNTALPPEVLVQTVTKYNFPKERLSIVIPPENALRKALDIASKVNGIVIVTGSFFLAGEARGHLKKMKFQTPR